MKRILSFFTALPSLGLLGLVFLLMAGVIAFATFSTLVSLYGSFDTNWVHIRTLNELQGVWSLHLSELQLDEYKYIQSMLTGGQAESNLQSISEHQSALDQSMNVLLEEMTPDGGVYTQEEVQQLQDLNSAMANHNQSFKDVATVINTGDTQQAQDLVTRLSEESAQLSSRLDDLITQIERDRSINLKEFPSEISMTIWMNSICFILILLLGLWGYRLIGSFTEPLLILTNAIIAIGGDKYRPELLAGTARKKNRIGKFAQALVGLAQALQARDANLKQEIRDLQQQLLLSRRSRLKISDPERIGRSA